MYFDYFTGIFTTLAALLLGITLVFFVTMMKNFPRAKSRITDEERARLDRRIQERIFR